MRILVSFLSLLILVPCLAVNADAQRRDHLTSEEVELVRDVQDVDLRMKIFAKAIDRRLIALNGTSSLDEKELKRLKKDESKWGKLKEGSRAILLTDIASILNESIDKFEDVYERDPKSELIPFAYHNLADYCETLVPRLNKIAGEVETVTERNAIARALKNCEDILAIRGKIPKPKKKKPKRRPY